MATYFLTVPASDRCIEFVQRYPDSLVHLLAGTRPDPSDPPAIADVPLAKRYISAKKDLPIPLDWPTEEAELGTQINHGNVDLYHEILNGTPDPSKGAGTIFQTWFMRRHAAIDLTGDRESFAFMSPRLPELSGVFRGVSKEMAAYRFRQWLRRKGDDGAPSEGEDNAVWMDFCFVRQQAEECADKGLGLIWVGV